MDPVSHPLVELVSDDDIHAATKVRLKVPLQARQRGERRAAPAAEPYQYVDVAIRPEVGPNRRSEHGKLRETVATRERLSSAPRQRG